MASRFSINVQDYIFNSEEFAEFTDEHKKFLVAYFREKAYTTPKYFEIRNRRSILHTSPKSMRHFIRYYKSQYQNMCPYYSTGEQLGISQNKLVKCRQENTFRYYEYAVAHAFDCCCSETDGASDRDSRTHRRADTRKYTDADIGSS